MEADQAAAGAILHIVQPGYKAEHIRVKTVIIMLSGLPGTGKSYLSRKLAERLGFSTLESDAVRKELFPRPSYSVRESTAVFRAIHNLIKERLQNSRSVIFDATNLEERHRKNVYRIAERTGARLILVEVEAPPQTVQKRLRARSLNRNNDNYSDATWETYQRMKKSADKIHIPHYTVNTEGDIGPIIEKIVKEASH